MHTYSFGVFGIPVTLTARNLQEARRKIVRRWIDGVSIHHGRLPVVPPILLISSNDPCALDTRMAAVKYLKVASKVLPFE